MESPCCNPGPVQSRSRRLSSPGSARHRALLSHAWLAIQSQGSAPKELVSLQVSSTYISQSARAIELTITRSIGSKRVPIKSPLTLSLSAVALSPASTRGGKPQVSNEIAPINQTVTFQPGEMSRTVKLPINVQAPLPTLAPVEITVAPNGTSSEPGGDHGGSREWSTVRPTDDHQRAHRPERFFRKRDRSDVQRANVTAQRGKHS